MEEHNRRHVDCLSCGARYPERCGVCPTCGAPPLQNTSSAPHRVVIPEIPSTRQRGELAERMGELLHCPERVGELTEAFATSKTVLCADLSRESALSLVDYLQRMHVSAIAESVGESGTKSDNWKWIVGGVALAAGLALIFAVGGFWAVLFGCLAGVFGGGILLTQLLAGRERARPALCMAPEPPSPLPGWDSMPAILASLLVKLDGPSREALSSVAIDIAFVQDELASESLAAFAAGGPGGKLDQTARKILTAAVARGRQVAADSGDEAKLTEALVQLAGAAGKARKRLEVLAVKAEEDGGGATGESEDVDALTAALDAELEDADQVVSSQDA